MRIVALAVAAALLSAPAAVPALADAQSMLKGVPVTDISAASKPAKKKHKPKAEYMKAVPVK